MCHADDLLNPATQVTPTTPITPITPINSVKPSWASFDVVLREFTNWMQKKNSESNFSKQNKRNGKVLPFK